MRDAAAHLLTGLPRSRFAARMAERAAPLIRVEDGRLVVALPGDPDAAAKRDGVPATGRRSERLHALLAATPLATWTGAEWSPYEAPPPAAATGAAETPSAARSPADAAPPAPGSPADAAPRAPGSPADAAPRAPADAAPPAPGSPADAAPRGLARAATAPASPADLVRLDVADDLGEIVRRGWADAAVAQRDAGVGAGPVGGSARARAARRPAARGGGAARGGRPSGPTSPRRPCPRRGARRSPAR